MPSMKAALTLAAGVESITDREGNSAQDRGTVVTRPLWTSLGAVLRFTMPGSSHTPLLSLLWTGGGYPSQAHVLVLGMGEHRCTSQ